jgi:hypothetical protein
MRAADTHVMDVFKYKMDEYKVWNASMTTMDRIFMETVDKLYACKGA